MSAGMPELGSKISLISKADIRYEGRLFTVDPHECTIALASVRSFGTEDRETQYPVAPQNQVYEFILFRGSDIKDIRIVNSPPVPNDPAIMQMSMPSMLGQSTFQAPGYTHPVFGAMAQQGGGPFGPSYGSMSGLGLPMTSGLGMTRPNTKPSELIMSGPIPPTELSPVVEPPRPNDHDLIGASRSTTPASLGSRKSSTNDQGVQVSRTGKYEKKVVKPIQPPTQNPSPIKERQDSKTEEQEQDDKSKTQRRPQRTYNAYNNYHRDDHSQQKQGNWVPRGMVRQRGGRPRGTYKPIQGQPLPQVIKNNKQLKFDKDYDFEQANTEFEELRSQFSKIKVDEGVKSDVNGKKDDSGNETGAGEWEPEEEQEVFYDKAKSFFDNISCEAVERSKGRSQRTDWRTERKLNSETFGVGSTRRGGYRGRGTNYRGGMGYRGTYRGGYRNQVSPRKEQQGYNRPMMQPNNQTRNVKPATYANADKAPTTVAGK